MKNPLTRAFAAIGMLASLSTFYACDSSPTSNELRRPPAVILGDSLVRDPTGGGEATTNGDGDNLPPCADTMTVAQCTAWRSGGVGSGGN